MTDTGGPYYPELYPTDEVVQVATLLDHFAGLFAQSIISDDSNVRQLVDVAKVKDLSNEKAVSMLAYEFAQAMITEKRRLEKK